MWIFDKQDESQDYIKRQQLRELALLNSNFREESPGPSGSVSPFNSSGMKRAKPGRWNVSFMVYMDIVVHQLLIAENFLQYMSHSMQL